MGLIHCRYKLKPSLPPYWWYVIMGILIMLFTSCKSVKSFEQQNTNRDSVSIERRIDYITKTKIDTVVVRDSVLCSFRNDTSFIKEIHYQYIYKYHIDTVYKLQKDTTAITNSNSVVVEKVVEKKKPFKDRMLEILAILTIGVIGAYIVKKAIERY